MAGRTHDNEPVSAGLAMLSIAVLGAGRIGRIHAAQHRRAPRRAAWPAIADADAAAAEQLADSLWRARHRALDAAFAADAVLIASPTPTHADYIERAAAAGRAVFCEKPIDLSAERVRACLAAVRAPESC